MNLFEFGQNTILVLRKILRLLNFTKKNFIFSIKSISRKKKYHFFCEINFTKKISIFILVSVISGRIHYSEMYDMLKNMDPPLGFGSKCPDRLAYKKLIRMNMPLDQEGKVNFTTTLFSLIRENLSIKMRSAEEMDQADVELRDTILNVWPFTAKEKIELLVPTTRGNFNLQSSASK